MNKKSMIKELVSEFAKAYGVGSSKFKEIYIKQDALVNKIDRTWKKEYIELKYNQFKDGRWISAVIHDLLY